MRGSIFLISLIGGVLAVSASRSTLDNDVSCSSTYYGSCTAQEGGATGADTNLDWIEISGDAYNDAGMPQDNTILATGGSGGSSAGGTIPVSWDFTLTTLFAGEVVWDITAEINTTAGNGSLSMNGEVDCPCTDSLVQGTGSFNLPGGGDITGWEYELNAGGIPLALDELTINVPGGGLELNAPATSAVPEPADAGLLLGGIGIVLFAMRRRKIA